MLNQSEIGNDFLETNKTKLDLEKQEMTVRTAEMNFSIIFLSKTIGTPAHLRNIQIKYIRVTFGYACSRTLIPGATRYTITEQQTPALIYCGNKFRQYIVGHKVIIQAVHHAFSLIKKFRIINGRLTRWTLDLQEFDLEIEYVPGRENMAADTLTRYPRRNEDQT